MMGKHAGNVLLLLLPLLLGCREQKKDIMAITQEEAAALIAEHVYTPCVSVFTDMASGLSFNTLTRVPGKTVDDKWVTLTERNIISIPAGVAETRKQQIKVLVDEAMLEKISDHTYLGRGAISGYYHKPVDYRKGEAKGEWTFEDKGSQYRLTKKGEARINPKSRPAMAFCIGETSISQPIIYRQPETNPDKVKVVFTVTLINTPTWITQPEMQGTFPYVLQQWERKKAPVRYKVYIKIVNGQYVIENDLVRLLD